MKKHSKSLIFLILVLVGSVTSQPTYAGRYTNQSHDFFTTVCYACGAVLAVTGVTTLVYYICNNCFRWTDHDILVWTENGTYAIQRKYESLNTYAGPLAERLKLFGSKTQITHTRNDKEWVIAQNPKLFPYHSVELHIKNDLGRLKDFLYYLVDRRLTRERVYGTINLLIDELEQLNDMLLTYTAYNEEEYRIDQKMDRLAQQRLEKERNDALHEQANAAYAQAAALHEQAIAQHNRPDVVVVVR